MAPVLITAAILALLAALWSFWHARRTMERLEEMLDKAIQGGFSEEHFDESRLSRMETRLAHYLSAAAISAGNVAAEKEKIKSLIADISHQTRTPLANILLYTQLLAERDLTGEVRGYVSALEEQTEKLQSLMDALVKMSRLETGVLTLHPVNGPLFPMLEGAVRQFVPKAAEKGITLTLVPTDAAAVFDPRWTAEAVCNLLDNAVKYTPDGGSVSVRVTACEMFCRIDVTDTGPGIPEEEQPKIFQRFYRSTEVRAVEGIGVGLYLARQIVEGQGGYSRVSSRPGEGAVFSLCLPRA
ncbi:MAG: HAMP domain-containing histidine kinase [Oscillibacter sp.]|nr:HAMP domain-containing histidine kinase [Oscillibacter sp.]